MTLQTTAKSEKCRVRSLSSKSSYTGDTIISGTVRSLYMSDSGNPFAGKVTVKRVFKGDKILEQRVVMIEGFGNRNICLSSPKLGETKIFFLKKVKLEFPKYTKYKLKLSDNILKTSLKNLKVLWKIEESETP